ncbi:Piso0_005784 [Millerozyma farinosa CBS 7064]|uniref:Piso0_005784 protein n=1 Tax=Pichia sorbitophila (strain ATCC MYA-4447 / BCRC 22081 / CBS 7064 / NBRC 10061 / NRRL Y-12695) TaxID=559304 RepID=G8Y2X3_PICSO|nr:Piso0_005784 [Millerozyma farinosa CBS 7064]
MTKDIRRVSKARSSGKRSRSGCLSCKRLKIKCNEARPTCEYCEHTGRVCTYAVVDKSTIDKRALVGSKGVKKNHLAEWQAMGSRSFAGQQKINQTSAIMGLSMIELKLLSFFNTHCVQLLSFGVELGVDHVWRHEVPKLFMGSEMLRNGIYSFAALNLWPRQNVYDPLDDMQITQSLKKGHGGSCGELMSKLTSVLVHRYDDNGVPQGSLLELTTNYFQQCIEENLRSITVCVAPGSEDAIIFSNKDRAAEVVTSCLLLFSYLCLHPHRIVPLVSFEPDTYGLDLISICLSFSKIFRGTFELLLDSQYRGIFTRMASLKNVTVMPNTFPLVEHLFRTLNDGYSSVISNDSEIDIRSPKMEEYQAIKHGARLLNMSLHHADTMRYPIPLFVWILLMDDPLCHLIKTKNHHALYLLYVYASLCCLSSFNLTGYESVFRDFVCWCHENMNLDETGTKLYYLSLSDDYELDFCTISPFKTFDLDEVYERVIGNQVKLNNSTRSIQLDFN